MVNRTTKIYFFIQKSKMKFKIIKHLHNFLKNKKLNTLYIISYPGAILYYLFFPFQNYKLSKRKDFLNNYNVFKVKLNYVKYWLETIWLTKNGHAKYVLNNTEIVNREAVDKLTQQKTGFIIALPHLGNWEFAIPFGKQLNLNLLAVAEPLEDKNILNWFTELRENLGCEIILGGKGQNSFDTLVSKINSGYHVCLLSERHVGKSGIGVEFFNNLAAFPKGPVALSLKTQVPILPATFIKIDNKYKLIFGTPFIVPNFDNEAQSIQHGLKVLALELEKLILLDPNQWHSIQPVWTSEY